MARMNSSHPNRPSESMSARAQICASVICGNFDCISIPRACAPVKKPLRVRSVVLNNCVYFSFAGPLIAHSINCPLADPL